MLDDTKITEPFICVPPEGPLPKLNIYELPFPLRRHFETSTTRSGNKRLTSFSKNKESTIEFGAVFDKKTYIVDDDLSEILPKEPKREIFMLAESNSEMLELTELNMSEINKPKGTCNSKGRQSGYKSSAKRHTQEKIGNKVMLKKNQE